jgi:hypothetical protein
MALPSAIKLFINPRTGLAFGNFNGTSQITNPTVTLGDTARFEIYLVEDTGISSYPRQEVLFPGTPGIKIAVGPIDESPQAGTWKVSFGGNITAALPFNITAAALASALNGLASITAAGGVTVSKIGDNYNIVFNQNGARGDLLTDAAALVPLSTATVANLQIGDSTRPQIAFIHLQRTIAGLATSFSPTAPSAIAIDSLSAWNGSRATYRASIAPDPKGGSFTLAFDAATGTDVSSPAIAVGASAVDVQNALNQGALVDKVSVTQVGAYAYDITITTQPGTNGLTASSAGLISFSGYVGELSLNTAEAISLLDGAEEVSTNLEVEITSDSKTLTILQVPCTLKNAVIDAGSVEPLILDSYLSQNSADGRYARQANNLSDLADVSAARTNLDVYSKGQVDTAISLVTTPSDVLTKAGNLSGLTNLPLARANIGLGSTNNAQFNSVFGVSGSQAPSQIYTNYNLGFSGYSRTLEHRTENTAEEGQGDNSYVDYSRVISISENGASFTNITNYGEPTLSGSITIERIISLDLANHRLRISDGNAECLLTNGALSFGNVETGYGLSIDAVDGLTFSNFGTPAAQFGPAGITFTDGTIQTTAAFNFDPSGYLTAFNNLSDLGDTAAARNNLGLGSTQDVIFGSVELTSGNQTLSASPNSIQVSEITYGFTDPNIPSVSVYSKIASGAIDIYRRTWAEESDWPSTVATKQRFTYDLSDGLGTITLLTQASAASTPVQLSINPAGITFPDGTVQSTAFTLAALDSKADLAGATFTGKANFTSVDGAAGINIGIGGTSASATTAGDLWITTGGANLNFRDGTGAWKVLASLQNGNVFTAVQTVNVNSASAALRVTQQGTGQALIVEDSTNPDTSALVVDASGNVGIGVAAAYTATEKLEVVGNIKADRFKNGSGPTFAVVSTTTHSSGSATDDLLISVGGSTYRIAMQLVSTP